MKKILKRILGFFVILSIVPLSFCFFAYCTNGDVVFSIKAGLALDFFGIALFLVIIILSWCFD